MLSFWNGIQVLSWDANKDATFFSDYHIGIIVDRNRLLLATDYCCIQTTVV